ncbi:MAG: polysaccharide deacetylase family protein [Solirubrobacteraceae bacterium]
MVELRSLIRIVSVAAALLVAGGCGGAVRPRQDASPPHVPASATQAAPTPRGLVLHGSRRRRWVALTFDADMTVAMRSRLRAGLVPGGWYDRALFSELHALRAPATIFLTGLWTSQYPGVVRRLAGDPLIELENHSVDHAGFLTPCYGLPTVADARQKRLEIVGARRTITAASGRAPRYFRFPGGCHTAADVRLVNSYGEQPVGWDVVSGDAFEPDPRVIVRAVLRSVRPGSIIVAHCIGAPNTPATARAMAQIVPALRMQGYRLVRLDQLLSAAGGAHG